MKQRPDASEVEKICAYCEYGCRMQNTGYSMCSKKKNLVALSGTCRKFKLDLLKLNPQLPLLPKEE